MPDSLFTADCLELVGAMAVLGRAFRQKLSPILQARSGLDLRLFLLIKRIKQGSVHPGDLAREMMETPSQITRQLDKLHDLGFVVRHLDKDDSRRIRLDLTDKATELLEGMDASLMALLEPALASLDPAGRRAMIDGLKQIADRL